MLLKLEKLIAKYGMKITGVIQAGAHEGEEIGDFLSAGIAHGHLFEPCEAFSRLKQEISLTVFKAYNYALSDKYSIGLMYITETNKGQSNSFLKPKKHLEYYPDIEFKEQVFVQSETLDSFKIADCNFLMMDVQGTEHLVLKGATETLKHIDYIYTEVNREELYENCAMVEDMDNYLTEFKRVQTVWKRKGFGDALYIKKTL